jgi:DNA-binding NtrC family response regulator
LTASAIAALQAYSWPGNIRELRNVLERAVLLSGSRVLGDRDLHFDALPEAALPEMGGVRTLEEVERQHIQEVLFLERGRVEAAAKRLGIPRSSLYNKIKQYGIARQASGATLH